MGMAQKDVSRKKRGVVFFFLAPSLRAALHYPNAWSKLRFAVELIYIYIKMFHVHLVRCKGLFLEILIRLESRTGSVSFSPRTAQN